MPNTYHKVTGWIIGTLNDQISPDALILHHGSDGMGTD